jgi:hypothetical protein
VRTPTRFVLFLLLIVVLEVPFALKLSTPRATVDPARVAGELFFERSGGSGGGATGKS